MIKIVLFGTGALSKFLTGKVKENVEIIAYIDSGLKGEINDIPIISVNDLRELEYDYIVVAFGNTIKGIEILSDCGVPVEKIVGYAYSGLDYNHNLIQQELEKLLHEKLRDRLITKLFDVNNKKYYLCGMNVSCNDLVIDRDFVREQTLSFLAEEIRRKKLEGSVAEVGVSSGEFAKKINMVFPDRKLYLFDTFSGLPREDFEKSIELGWGEKQYAFCEKGTDPSVVLEKMPFPEKCVIKKGCFPTSYNIEEKLVFVALDIDFYHSIYEGLGILYKNLVKGGYILVHDFHNLAYTESYDAIANFCDENNAPYIPLPDNGGSVVIVK